MTDQRNNAPRRYFVDTHGHRVLIGLSLEETVEFESLDGLSGVGEGGAMVGGSENKSPAATQGRRWLQLYAKHDEAWKAWIAKSRSEQAASSAFVNYS